ncbi:hypothetical protein H7R52_16950 [Weissella confusa]|uniref:3-dehydroquinate synthase N-terminal domain-containing protein n=1 Tax=Weissella confusa TaxID=1583 RepID=A0A923NHE5_WEICO|nr:hypothetical protein [Weissella confusa]
MVTISDRFERDGITEAGLTDALVERLSPVGLPVFSTLSDRDLVEGYAEVVKTSALAGGEFWKWTGRMKTIADIRANAQWLIEQSVQYKADIVMADEKEGGVVIGDTAGFVASIYMRGIAFIQVATSLTAQVDSSVGGKNAINMADVKNIMGTFYQPDLVIIDPDYLEISDENVAEHYFTLTARNLVLNGFEVVPAVLPAGEQTKSLEAVNYLDGVMAEQGFTRQDGVIALGGGMVHRL